MATIDIRRSYTAPKDEARALAEKFIHKMQERFELEWSWTGDRLSFTSPRGAAKGTKGSLDVDNSEVRIQIDLPLLLRVFKGTLEGRLQEGLKQLK